MRIKHKSKKYRNSGYSEGGASHAKQTLKAWQPKHFDAVADIDYNLETLRSRAADLAMNSPLGAAALQTQISGVINEGLNVYPKLDYEALGIDGETARKWTRRVKAEFELWAESVHCDFNRRNTFKELQRIAYRSSLMDGDSFCLFKRETPSANNPYSLKLHLVEAGRVSTPQGKNILIVGGANVESVLRNGGRIVNGIETDRRGRLKAIWISNRIYNQFTAATTPLKWQRVLVYGETSGARNVLHICNDGRIGQFRGEPYLAPVIETLKNLSRYAEAELVSGIIKSYFSLFFTQLSSDNNFTLNQILPDELDLTEYKLGAGTLNALPRGVDVKAIDSEGTTSFEAYTQYFSKVAGAALGIPAEVLTKTFNSSYSASKAALLQAENEFRQRKESFITDFCRPIYEMFLAEAVALGRIEAPGFFTDGAKQKIYCAADWHNETSHFLDVEKEVRAAETRIALGLSTHSKEAAELSGTNYVDNLRQLGEELTLRKAILGDNLE